jgi:hypothetical protein
VEIDAFKTVKAWDNGENIGDAIEQAKKNAIHDIFFNSIPDW